MPRVMCRVVTASTPQRACCDLHLLQGQKRMGRDHRTAPHTAHACATHLQLASYVELTAHAESERGRLPRECASAANETWQR